MGSHQEYIDAIQKTIDITLQNIQFTEEAINNLSDEYVKKNLRNANMRRAIEVDELRHEIETENNRGRMGY
jgi:polyhydroxyalkanoate synthesis regulator phasin